MHDALRRAKKGLLSSVLVLSMMSCHRPHAPALQETDSLDQIGSAYLRVALALAERDPDSIDYDIAPPSLRDAVHREYLPLGKIEAEAAALQSRLGALSLQPSERQRACFLRLQLAAICFRTHMLRGQTVSFDAEARELFHTERLPDRWANQRALTREQIRSLLPRQTARENAAATLAERYAAYDRQFLIPAGDLEAVMNAALASCRTETLKHLRLPAQESVTLRFVRNRPWSGFSRYEGNAHSEIYLNLDYPVTVDEALELACHEGYPGHHTFNTLRDLALAQHKVPEAEVQLTFTPQSYVSEAAAAYAPALALSPETRLKLERDVLFPLAGLPRSRAERYVRLCLLLRQLDSAEPAIAAAYLDRSLEFVRAEQQMQDQMLMTHPEASLLYLNEYRSYMLAYTDGTRRMEAFLQSQSEGEKPVEGEGSKELAWRRFEGLTRTEVESIPRSCK